VQQLELKTLSL